MDETLDEQIDAAEEEQQAPTLDDDEELQKKVISKIIQHNSKGKANRMEEVQNARDQRLYFRGIQQFYWSEDTENVVFDSDSDSPYDRTFNIYQGYGKIFISTFMGARPKVRPEADNPFDPISIRNTSKAATYERIYNKFNDMPTMQMKFARLIWTDGRVMTRTTTRDGKEFTEFFGVLESRLPITVSSDDVIPLKNCTLVEIENEFPQAQMKKEFPEARKKINSGNGDSYERNARIAVKRHAGTDTSIDVQTGEDAYSLATKTWSYMRPEFFEHFEEADRSQLEEMYPDGLCVVRNGDVYLGSYPEDIDSRLDVIFALPGDGMSPPSVGAALMPLQDSVNTGQNLIEEMFDHGLSTTYYDTATDIDGLNKTREMPGASRKMTRKLNEPASNSFFQTQPVNPPEQLVQYIENVKGPQSQFVSGQQPALFGAEMEDQKTASGYAQARNMALGQMAIVWKPFTAWNAREKTRAVRLASQGMDEIATTLPPQRKGGKPEPVKLSPSDLQGLSFTNESDENFPETWTEKSNKIMQMLQMGGDIADWVLEEEPDNLYLLKEYIGLQDVVYPGEDLRNNVLEDIAAMKDMVPEPDITQMPEQAFPGMGQPAPAVQPVSPIALDTEYLEDADYKIGFRTVKHWMQTAGRGAKQENPQWFENVRLYGLQYKQKLDEIEAAKQQAMQPLPEAPKGPGETIGYKDLPISGKIQLAAKGGIQLTPEDIQGQELQDAAAKAPTGVQ